LSACVTGSGRDLDAEGFDLALERRLDILLPDLRPGGIVEHRRHVHVLQQAVERELQVDAMLGVFDTQFDLLDALGRGNAVAICPGVLMLWMPPKSGAFLPFEKRT
jgi:hypothetical protein